MHLSIENVAQVQRRCRHVGHNRLLASLSAMLTAFCNAIALHGRRRTPTTCGKSGQWPLMASRIYSAELELVACTGESVGLPVLGVHRLLPSAEPSMLEDILASKAC